MHHGRTHSDTAGRGAGGHAGRLGLRSSGKARAARRDSGQDPPDGPDDAFDRSVAAGGAGGFSPFETQTTVLSRLADKGFLRIEKTGRSAEYRPLVAREDYLARQGRKFYDTLCGGSLPAFAAALCASGLTAEELAELRELLREGTL